MATVATEHKQGPTTESANEFARFELARLGYDVDAAREVHPSTEDADDLVQAILGEKLEPAVYSAVIWAVRNRPVNWLLHVDDKTHNDRQVLDARILGHCAGAELPPYDPDAVSETGDLADALEAFDRSLPNQ